MSTAARSHLPSYDGSMVPAQPCDPALPNPARMSDHWLGGGDNYAADRDLVDRINKIAPGMAQSFDANRQFQHRAVRHAAGSGVRKFIDIGCGLPATAVAHLSARAQGVDACVVYVDRDPIALAHARAVLAENDRTGVVPADLREPSQILDSPQIQTLIDFRQPVCVILTAVLHFLREEDDPYGVVAQLVRALAPGSYLVVSHLTGEIVSRLVDEGGPQSAQQFIRLWRAACAEAAPTLRGKAEVARFLEGLELVEPGVVRVDEWRPESSVASGGRWSWMFGGMGQVPQPKGQDR